MEQKDVLDLQEMIVSDTEKLVMLPLNQEDIGSHSHRFFELAYITNGSCIHVLNGTTSCLKKGDFFFMDFESIHSYKDSKELALINCLFLPEIIDDTLRGCQSFDTLLQNCLIRYYSPKFHETPVNHIFHDEEGQVLQLLNGMQKEYQEKKAGYGEIFRCRLIEILILTLRYCLPEKRKRPNSTAILEVVQYVDRYYGEAVTLSLFCQEHHYNLPYISRKFKEETGRNFKEYLQKVRIEKCCELLAGSDMPISEAAQRVGYHDMKFFYQVFKKYVKMTPKEYRKL